ncbi:glucose 1-dehydrogenase [Acrocarpospora macrocephala]|uniref:Short-chain dehydrogenase n=1 Tax=Acrocarpospora macrocephala TaxID=150177 RepID=A0A5M3WX07_9ACTN|nr:SDR family oxidoreductase [Acrocarpospora macrocephala]GES11831.1 short-chain dehydrogenase [Acrocarpospora macrocephala]
MIVQEFHGAVAVVTGAGSGIGHGVVTALAARGAQVVAADLDPAGLPEAPGIRTVTADVTSPGDVRRVFAAADSLGGADLLVNAAGIAVTRPLLEHTDDDWDRVLAVNLKGSFLCLREAARTMTARRRGSVVNVSSIVSIIASPTPEIAYDASKGGVSQLTRSAAAELGPHGVRVNAVAPGPVPTALYGPPAGAVARNIPLGRLGTVEDIVAPILFLCSTAAAWITGHVLVVDGGRVLR